MAKGASFGRGYAGSLRPPLSYGEIKQLTANPMQQAGQMVKGSQLSPSRPTKLSLSGGGQRGARAPRGNPFKSMPFYGE